MTLAFEVCHVARLVTSCVEPSENAADAVYWRLPPTTGAVPLTVTLETVAADSGLVGEEQADRRTAAAQKPAPTDRRNMGTY
jgi:hypothetical protein